MHSLLLDYTVALLEARVMPIMLYTAFSASLYLVLFRIVTPVLQYLVK